MLGNARQWSSRQRKVVIATGSVVALVAVLVGGAFAATASMNMANPVTIARAVLTNPSERAKFFPSREIAAPAKSHPFAEAPVQLPPSVPWKGGDVTVEDFLATTKANSFLILKDGKLAHEWYRDGVTRDTPQWSYSVAKSVTSLLAGIAIDRGTLSEDDLLVDVVPELRTGTGTGYDTITIRNLLDMTSGVDVSENTSSINPFSGTVGMGLSTDLDDFLSSNRDLAFAPGSKGEYRSVDTALLGAAVVRSEGKSLSELLQDEIWGPVGAESPATWTIDHPGGREQGFAGLNATARDFAKIGQLVLDNGKVGDTQAVPAAWIERIRTEAPEQVDGMGYSAQWWHPNGGSGKDFSAIGIYGQYIYIDPVTGTVIVKLSDYGPEQDEQETIEVFRSLATHLAH